MSSSVLIVDDSASVRHRTRHMLESRGYHVVEACDGRHGLEACEAGEFDLILVDINMPNMDGLQMSYRVRSLPAHVATPIIVVSCELTPDLRKRGINAGVTGWVLKPLSDETLDLGIRDILEPR